MYQISMDAVEAMVQDSNLDLFDLDIDMLLVPLTMYPTCHLFLSLPTSPTGWTNN